MKIEFTFRFVELWNKRKSFLLFFDKRFSNQTSNEKIFSNLNFQNLLEEEKSDERYSNERHFRHSSSNLFQNSTNLQVMNVVLPVNFSSNPTIELGLKHDNWLFCLFTLSRSFSFICKMSKSLNSIDRIRFVFFKLFQRWIFPLTNNAEISSEESFFPDYRTSKQIFLFVNVTNNEKEEIDENEHN